MLKILNNLKPFFEDTQREISVREFAKEIKVTPPTASTTLKLYEKENILNKREFKNNLLFRINKNDLFEDLAKIFWKILLREELKEIHKKTMYKKIILFGSIAKTENTKESDIDIFIDTKKRQINTKEEENKLKRKIQLHFKEELSNKNLQKNIQ